MYVFAFILGLWLGAIGTILGLSLCSIARKSDNEMHGCATQQSPVTASDAEHF